MFGRGTVDIILLNLVLLGECLDGTQWISSSQTSSSEASVWMVHTGNHLLKHRPLMIVFGWCLDGAQWILFAETSSS